MIPWACSGSRGGLEIRSFGNVICVWLHGCCIRIRYCDEYGGSGAIPLPSRISTRDDQDAWRYPSPLPAPLKSTERTERTV